MYNPFSLQGKTILITGASSGIGRATAIECSKMGANTVITGRNGYRLKETFNQLQGENNSMFICDLNLEENLNHLIDKCPSLNGIVHCAGLTKITPFQFAKRDKIDEVFDVNFLAPAELTRRIICAKKIEKNSSIVFISSISGVYCSAVASSIYSASKGAIDGLAKGMAIDLAPKQIRVNCINPGMIETNIFDAGEITNEQFEEDKSRYPLKRYGRPEEVAHAVIYLLSDASSWVTGSNLKIDGGFTLL